MNYLACGTVTVWDSHDYDVQQSMSMDAGQPFVLFISQGCDASCRQRHSMCSLDGVWSCFPPHFLPKVNLGKSAVGGWSCRESVSFQWLSKPWRWATQRNREEISWEKQASWGNLTTPTSSTWKVSSQKVSTTCCGLLCVNFLWIRCVISNSGCWESWLGEKDLGDACSKCTFIISPKKVLLSRSREEEWDCRWR